MPRLKRTKEFEEEGGGEGVERQLETLEHKERGGG